MKTYDTYQRAKAENPDTDILVSNVGKFHAVEDSPSSHFANGWKLCSPADYEDTVEWKNGDECDVWSSGKWHSGDHTFIGLSKCKTKYVICYNYLTNYVEFPIESVRKPETPEAKQELEAAYDLSITGVDNPVSFEDWAKWEPCNHRHYIAIVRKTGYTKER